MNKIYSLKYSAATGGLIAVSELAKRVSGKTNRKLVATMLSLAVAGTVNAANIDISNGRETILILHKIKVFSSPEQQT